MKIFKFYCFYYSFGQKKWPEKIQKNPKLERKINKCGFLRLNFSGNLILRYQNSQKLWNII